MNECHNFSSGISILEITYVVASVLFIIGLKMLSHPLTARRGNNWLQPAWCMAIIATIIFHQKDGEPIRNIPLILSGHCNRYGYRMADCQKGKDDRNASACFIF